LAADGKELFYDSGGKLMSIDVKDGSGFEPSVSKLLFESKAPAGISFDASGDG